MAITYSFLKDESALLEIRKHKWIESEKQGKEIGFATAAVDWIKRYGGTWKQRRFETAPDAQLFSEKRKHRRFHMKCPIQVSMNKNRFKSQTNEISLVGLSCTLPESIPMDSQAEVTLLIKNKSRIESRFQFKSRIARISHPSSKSGYLIFLPFTEEVRDYLRTNSEILSAN